MRYLIMLSFIFLFGCFCPNIVQDEAGNPSCECQPQTCQEQGKDCGIIDDGCGLKINCGFNPNNPTECSNPYFKCGAGPIQNNCLNAAGVPNVCGGGCAKTSSDHSFCSNNKNKESWFCTTATYDPLQSGCVSLNGIYPTQGWCCP